jgi:hypothetical protein
MRKAAALLVCVVAAAVLAASAAGADFHGIVVGKDVKRGMVTTVSKHGKIRTVHAGASKARHLKVGQKLHVRGHKLKNGTFAARQLAVEDDQGENEDGAIDEVEFKGTVTAIGASIVVESGPAVVTCGAPTGGFGTIAVGDVVELKCELVNGTWVATETQVEDSATTGDDDQAEQDDDDDSGPGSVDDDQDSDDSGPGEVEDSGDDQSDTADVETDDGGDSGELDD